MERLTYRHRENSIVVGANKGITYVLGKLADYEDAEEQGLLLRLPCKVGDVIYQVNSDVDEYAISEISIREDKMLITAENLEKGLGFCFDTNRIGKNYFLTREEAEQALKQMGE